ncbi:MAG: class I SAM-dependent methyltransferase [Chloroflexota bacterium]
MTEARAARLARWYDLDLLDDPGDLALYQALAAQADGPVLELAAGSGRIAVPLACAGHAVTALDNDAGMLARCAAAWATARGRRPAEGLACVHADLRDARLGASFALVILAQNAIALLPDAAGRQAAFATVAAHLAPGGRVVADLLLPSAAELSEHDGRVRLEWLRPDPETGESVAKLTAARHDAALRVTELVQVFDATPADGGPVHRTTRTDRIALLSADELVGLADGAGLVVETLAGDLDLSPFGSGAERVVLVARRPSVPARRGARA